MTRICTSFTPVLAPVLALLLALLLAPLHSPAAAQEASPQPIFRDYAHMREVLDGAMKERRIIDVMRAFGGADEMTIEELTSLQARVRLIFPSDLETVELLRRETLAPGWRHELYAYWSGINYLYAYVLMHDQPAGFIAISFRFNTDFEKLHALF